MFRLFNRSLKVKLISLSLFFSLLSLGILSVVLTMQGTNLLQNTIKASQKQTVNYLKNSLTE